MFYEEQAPYTNFQNWLLKIRFRQAQEIPKNEIYATNQHNINQLDLNVT